MFVVMMVVDFQVMMPIMMVPFVSSMAFFPIPVVLFIMMPVVLVIMMSAVLVIMMPVVKIPVRMFLPVMFPGFIMPVVPVMMIFFHLIITIFFAMRFMRAAVPVMGKRNAGHYEEQCGRANDNLFNLCLHEYSPLSV